MTAAHARFTRRLGLGRLWLHAVYQPWCRLRDRFHRGTAAEQQRTREGLDAMIVAASTLPRLDFPGPPVELHLLTGAAFWHQTAFCLHSFSLATRRSVAPSLYDDGTLTREQASLLARQFPRATVQSTDEIRARLDSLLPRDQFPRLRERWDHYPNIRKLIAPHLGSPRWRLVLDSDLLFFREPTALLQWLDAPVRPLVAADVETSYGYSRSLLRAVAGEAPPERINVGICGLRGDQLDWTQIEAWCDALISAENASYYLEQALVALLAVRRPFDLLPAHDYVTSPDDAELRAPRAVMHHYVAGTKVSYVRDQWRRFVPHHTP